MTNASVEGAEPLPASASSTDHEEHAEPDGRSQADVAANHSPGDPVGRITNTEPHAWMATQLPSLAMAAAPPERAGEAGDVGEHTTADGDHRLGAAEGIEPLELIEHEEAVLHRFVVFVARRDHGVELQVERFGPAPQRVA